MHPCFSAAIQGKVKILEDLFVIRTNHERRILLPDFEATLEGEFWESSVKYSINELSSIISENKINLDADIEAECKEIWQAYIEKCKENFKLKTVRDSSSRLFVTKLKILGLFLIRLIIKDFKKTNIQDFLIKKEELETYESFVEALSISYNRKP